MTVLNAPGTVDAGYRGEILVNLINHDRDTPARISGATGSRSWWSSGSPVPSSSRWSSCPGPGAGPAGTGPPAARRPGSGSGRRARAKRWQGECEQRRVGAVIFSRKRAGEARHGVTTGSSTPGRPRRRRLAAPTTSARRPTRPGSTWAASRSRRCRTWRCGCRPTPQGRDPAGGAGARAERVAARRVRRAPFGGHLGRGARGDPHLAAERRRRRPGGRGERGTELRGPGPHPGRRDRLRFIGIDGPRWMVRGVFQGQAASTRSPAARSRPAWTAWWWTAARRPSRSVSRCRCGCRARWPSKQAARAAGRRAAGGRSAGGLRHAPGPVPSAPSRGTGPAACPPGVPPVPHAGRTGVTLAGRFRHPRDPGAER